MSKEWYRFFLNLFVLTGSGASQATLADLQVQPVGVDLSATFAEQKLEYGTNPPPIDYSADITRIRTDVEIGNHPPFPSFGTLAYQNTTDVRVTKVSTLDTDNVSHSSFYEDSQYAVLNGDLGVTLSAGGIGRAVIQPTGLRPFANGTYDLGTSLQFWKAVYSYEYIVGVFQNVQLQESSGYAVLNGASGVTLGVGGSGVFVAQSTGVRPFSDVSYSLGTSSQRWSSAYLYEAYIGNGGASVKQNSGYIVLNDTNGIVGAVNGTQVTVTQNTGFRPFADVSYSLGTSSQRWSSAYLYEIYAGNGTTSLKQDTSYAVLNDVNGTVQGVNGTGVLVTQSTGIRPFADNTYSVGTSSQRWTVVYATTGTINTSDATQKQQVRLLSEAEQRVAQHIKCSIRAYKFNDAVALKGNAARIHIGVMAQDIKQAFLSEGLDASQYGLFCEDENGLGVRYDELLAFVIGAL